MLVVLPGYHETLIRTMRLVSASFRQSALAVIYAAAQRQGGSREFFAKRYALGMTTLSPVSLPASSPADPQNTNPLQEV